MMSILLKQNKGLCDKVSRTMELTSAKEGNQVRLEVTESYFDSGRVETNTHSATIIIPKEELIKALSCL